MKKFVLFLMVVFMGVFPTVSSYAIDEPTFMGFGVDALFSDEKGSSTNSIDKCIIRSSVDTSANDSDECLYLLKDDKKSASQGGSSHLYCNSKWCANNTLVFAKDDVSRGGFGTTNFSGPVLMRCETGLNDSWEKVGGIDKLPECGNSAPEKTITVNGKTVRCKRKETRGNQEYCIGIKSGDICVDSGNGKPAEKPKAKEVKEEVKTEPIEENNEPKETCDTKQGYEYNPVSKKCERTEAEKAEEKKEDPKKEEPKKAAPKAKQPAPAKSTKKTPQEEFAEYCGQLPKDLGEENPDVNFTHELSSDGTVCTIKSTGSVKHATFTSGLNKIIEKAKNEQVKCEELKYTKPNTYSITCTEDGFTSTLSLVNTKITCEETQIFNDDTGKCDTKAAEEPAKAENAPAAAGSTEGENAEAAPAEESAAPAAAGTENNQNGEWAALHNDAKRIVKAYNDQKTNLENKQK